MTTKENMTQVSRMKLSVICIVALATIVALFYAEENYRHMAAWNAYKQKTGLDKHPLNFRDFLPNPVPDAVNFAKTPLLVKVGIRQNEDRAVMDHLNRYGAGSYVADGNKGVRADLNGYLIDLEKRHGAVARTNLNLNLGRTVLEAMKGVEPELSELREATKLPRAQFECIGTDPWQLTIPNFVAIRTLSQMLCVRACAFLDANQPDEALKDLQVVHRLQEAMKSNNTLVTAMIRVAVGGLEVGTFWEGWSRKAWTKAQYETLQKYYQDVDFLQALQLSINGGERAGIHYMALNYEVEKLRDVFAPSHDKSTNLIGSLKRAGYELGFKLAPNSWRYASLQLYDSLMVPMIESIDPVNQRIDFKKLDKTMEEVMEKIEGRNPIRLLSSVAMPNFGKAFRATCRNQTMVNMAGLVCALERFKADKGQYPEQLQELSAGYVKSLPHELATGESLKYRREKNGRFTLYSVGVDGKDEGGKAGASIESGDWSWPSMEASVGAYE